MYKLIPIKDLSVKLICIPLLGILVPYISEFINPATMSPGALWATYGYFVLIVFLVWEGNVQLMYIIWQKREWQIERYYKIIIGLFLTNIVYSSAVTSALLCIWKWYLSGSALEWKLIVNTSLIIIVLACFITNIYEIFFLNNERAYNLSRVEQLNVAKAQAELEALKNQIDPHFIFNSLNTLSYLIGKDKNGAKLFNDTLAKIYRYILCNRDKDLVMLNDELEFLHNYFYLLKIRFRTALNMQVEIMDMAAEDFLIPPISLQALLENAIKHNEFSEKVPLMVHITVTSSHIIVKNAIRLKAVAVPSSQIGLSNLSNRYMLIMGKSLVIEQHANYFYVKLPVLKI